VLLSKAFSSQKSPFSHFLLGMAKDAALVVSVVKFGAKRDGSLPESKEYLAGDHHTDRRSYEINPEGVPIVGVKS
jgi:hypothetical protein